MNAAPANLSSFSHKSSYRKSLPSPTTRAVTLSCNTCDKRRGIGRIRPSAAHRSLRTAVPEYIHKVIKKCKFKHSPSIHRTIILFSSVSAATYCALIFGISFDLGSANHVPTGSADCLQTIQGACRAAAAAFHARRSRRTGHACHLIGFAPPQQHPLLV
jgi:hypothetical protein